MVNTKTGLFEDVLLPEGYILILPGYTLQRATCGIYKAAAHQVVSFNFNIFGACTSVLCLLATYVVLRICVKLWYRKDTIKANLYGLLPTQTMRDVEGERLAVTFKLRSPNTALLDFHTALTAAGKQVEPRYMPVLHLHTLVAHLLSMLLACQFCMISS